MTNTTKNTEATPTVNDGGMKDATFTTRIKKFAANNIELELVELIKAAIPHSLVHGDYKRINLLSEALKTKPGLFKSYRYILRSLSAWNYDTRKGEIKAGTKVNKDKKANLLDPNSEGHWEKVLQLGLQHMLDPDTEAKSFDTTAYKESGIVSSLVRGLINGVQLTPAEMAAQMTKAIEKAAEKQKAALAKVKADKEAENVEIVGTSDTTPPTDTPATELATA